MFCMLIFGVLGFGLCALAGMVGRGGGSGRGGGKGEGRRGGGRRRKLRMWMVEGWGRMDEEDEDGDRDVWVSRYSGE